MTRPRKATKTRVSRGAATPAASKIRMRRMRERRRLEKQAVGAAAPNTTTLPEELRRRKRGRPCMPEHKLIAVGRRKRASRAKRAASQADAQLLLGFAEADRQQHRCPVPRSLRVGASPLGP